MNEQLNITEDLNITLSDKRVYCYSESPKIVFKPENVQNPTPPSFRASKHLMEEIDNDGISARLIFYHNEFIFISVDEYERYLPYFPKFYKLNDIPVVMLMGINGANWEPFFLHTDYESIPNG